MGPNKKRYLEKNNISHSELAVKLGYTYSSSVITALVRHKVTADSSGLLVVIKAYAVINGIISSLDSPKSNKTDKVDKNIKGDELSLKGAKESKIEGNTISEDKKCEEIVPTPINNESNKNECDKCCNNSDIIDEEKITIPLEQYRQLVCELNECHNTIIRLRQEKLRYEKLIDLIK